LWKNKRLKQPPRACNEPGPAPAPHFDLDLKPTPALYLAVGLEAGAVIALQICIMRIFSVAAGHHFGSLVVSPPCWLRPEPAPCVHRQASSIAIGAEWQRRAILFGPLTVAASPCTTNSFNAIFLVSDPMQKWRLAGNFMLLHAAVSRRRASISAPVPRGQQDFRPRVFADLSGARPVRLGIPGWPMYLCPRKPHRRAAYPVVHRRHHVVLGDRQRSGVAWLAAARVLSIAAHFVLPPLSIFRSSRCPTNKGVAYRRKFPDSARVYERTSPFGYLEVYSSSYLHSPPGLRQRSVHAAEDADNAYLGMYIDGEGPSGIIATCRRRTRPISASCRWSIRI